MTTNTREAHKVPEPRSRDAEHSRVAILAAARDEFAEYGLGGAQVDRIAERADVNKRLLCATSTTTTALPRGAGSGPRPHPRG